MIRFRNNEDERRYNRLHTEMFVALAQAGVSPERIALVMRNIGKVESMLHLEGMRQGLAMAAIAQATADHSDPSLPSPLPDPYSFKAYQLHSLIYGSSDTPLRAVEKEWLARLGIDIDYEATGWLDDKPLRFAPMTLEEWLGQGPPKAPVYQVQSPYKPHPVGAVALGKDGSAVDPSTAPSGAVDFGRPDDEKLGDLGPLTEADEGLLRSLESGEGTGDADRDARIDDALREIAQSDRDPVEIMKERGLLGDHKVRTTTPAPEDPDAPESPDFLDQVRSELLALQKTGFKPTTWQELILTLHRHLKVDAAYLDLQLSTQVGRAVLDQVGLPGIAPGSAISMAELFGELPTPGAGASRDPAEGF